jgi:hypothetical protein
MYATRIALVVSFGLTAFAQSGVTVPPNGSPEIQGVGFNARVEPLSPGPWAQSFWAGSQSRIVVRPSSYFVGHRFIYDAAHHVYLGYDLLIESQPQADTFRASFLELGIGVMDLPVIAQFGLPTQNPGEWKKLPLAKYPAPQLIHVGDVISIELWIAPDTGQKIIDEVHINEILRYALTRNAAPPGLMARTAAAAFTPPTVPGPAREFSADDAEMRIGQFRISVNGTPETPPKAATASAGALIWFSLPNRGRYVLSLAPHPALGFSKAGEVRGGVVTFTLDGTTIKLECPMAIAPGNAAYNLYVMHDPQWEPTAQAQRGDIQYGSVDIGELAKLVQN